MAPRTTLLCGAACGVSNGEPRRVTDIHVVRHARGIVPPVPLEQTAVEQQEIRLSRVSTGQDAVVVVVEMHADHRQVRALVADTSDVLVVRDSEQLESLQRRVSSTIDDQRFLLADLASHRSPGLTDDLEIFQGRWHHQAVDVCASCQSNFVAVARLRHSSLAAPQTRQVSTLL